MESFRKSLITEAAFNVKSLVTVVDKIRIILERRVSEKFYQYGGEGGALEFKKTKTGDGVGILFLIGDRGKAVRLNWEKKNAKPKLLLLIIGKVGIPNFLGRHELYTALNILISFI